MMTTVIHLPPILFKLGASLIHFTSNGIDPSCSLNIPIIGGTVKGEKGKIFAINPDVYTLLISAIPLASAKARLALNAIRKIATNPSFLHPPTQLASLLSTSVLALMQLRSSFK